MNYVRKVPTLQELILQHYELWLCNVWYKVNSHSMTHGMYAPGILLDPFDTQIAEIMKEVYAEEIPYQYGKIFQLMTIRNYLKTRPGKVLEIAQLYHQRYYD